jgi:Ca2+-binding RTX toxin-like protein
MANKTIKGGFKSYVVDDSKNTYTLAKTERLIYGGDIEIPEAPEDPEDPVSIDLSFGYGIVEDLTSGSDFKANVYNIDGKLTGLLGGIATFGDGTRINIGKTADVNAQLGIGIGSITDISDPSALAGLTFGTIFAAGDGAKVTIAKGAEIGGLFGVTVTGQASSVTNSGEMDNALVGMMAGSFNLTGSESGKASATATKLTNNGSIEAGAGMVGFTSDDVVLTNGKKGEIEGLLGMIGGAIPTGEVEDPTEIGAVTMKNSGDIIAAIGMLGIFSLNMSMTNAKGAEIIAGAIGIATMTTSLEGAPEGFESSVKITNAGTIRTTIGFDLADIPEELGGGLGGLMPAAILGFMGDETVLNTGKLYGHVILGEGNDKFTMKAGLLEGDTLLGGGADTFAFAGGQIKGNVYGGDGDDTYVVTKSLPKIIEVADQGVDTVKSAVSYTLGDNLDNLTLTGKKDINGTGNELANSLTGNAGNNKLTGGEGDDTFFFGTKGGTDTIADFTTGEDVIDVSKWTAIADFADLLTHAEDIDGSVRIKDGKDVLIIDGVLKAELLEADFAFTV